MDFGKRHAEFVLEAPEAREKDGAREEIVLAVFPFDHEREVILDEPCGHLHWVFGQWPLDDVERVAYKEVVDPESGLFEERGVALGEIGTPIGKKGWSAVTRRADILALVWSNLQLF